MNQTARVMRTETPYADALELSMAANHDEPVFCFSPSGLQARLAQFRAGFPGRVSYAVKANPSAAVLATLSAAGLRHWDVASVHEIAAVQAIQPGAVFHYHNPVKSRREIFTAYHRFGCRRFAVDAREEVEKIAAIVGGDREVELAVRFVLPRERALSAHDFSTKFGAPEATAAQLVAMISRLGLRPALTFHPGSQSRDPAVYVRHIEAARRIVDTAATHISTLNVGGGFPASYPLSRSPDHTNFFEAIEAATARCFDDVGRPLLECEPGRGLVASSMSLLTHVKLVCSDGDDVFINDGVYGGLMEFMQVPELQPPHRVIRDGAVLDGPVKPWKVFGPTCDPLDVLPAKLDLPIYLREDDYIEFGTLGAYGLATATRFNGYGDHAVVTVESAFNGT